MTWGELEVMGFGRCNSTLQRGRGQYVTLVVL